MHNVSTRRPRSADFTVSNAALKTPAATFNRAWGRSTTTSPARSLHLVALYLKVQPCPVVNTTSTTQRSMVLCSLQEAFIVKVWLSAKHESVFCGAGQPTRWGVC